VPRVAAELLSATQRKELGTSIRRQQHFYQFLSRALSINDVTLNGLPLSVTNGIFYMYAVTLTVSDSIQGSKVKENTIRGYLRAAAMYVKSVGMRTDCPMTDPDTGKLFAPIEQCLRDFKRWEAMPRRHSPLTKKMVRDLLAFCKEYPPDSKEKAFADWCIIGLHVGYRHCKWASEKAPKHSTNFPRADDPVKSIYQVLLNDIRLIGTGGKRIADELTYPAAQLQAVKIRVRFQKMATKDKN
jgi:hypothetical protein